VTTAEASSAAAVWQLAGPAAGPTADPLGLWRSAPPGPADAAAFDAGASPVGTVWRVLLPADAAAADTLLTRVELRLAQIQLALAAVEDPLRAFVAGRAATPFAGSRASPVSRRELDRLLAELPIHPTADGAVEFAPGRLSRLWEQVVAEATAFLARLDEATADHSRVETEQGRRLLAVTELTWGATKTVWRSRSSTDDRALHERAVRLAFESRLALVQTFVTAIRAAIVIAALFTPGGALLAFPAALRFVARFLAEVDEAPNRRSAAAG
jgi:hypothetical protein